MNRKLPSQTIGSILVIGLFGAGVFASKAEESYATALVINRDGKCNTNFDSANVTAGLRDIVQVEVNGLSETQRSTAKDRSKIIFFLNNLPFRGLCSDSSINTNSKASKGTFLFRLERTDSTRTNLTALFGSPKSLDPKSVCCAVGFDDGSAPIEVTNKFNLIVLSNDPLCPALSENIRTEIAPTLIIIFLVGLLVWAWRQKNRWNKIEILLWLALLIPTWIFVGHFWVWLVLFALFITGFVWLARCTELLRDAGPVPPKGKLRPYSLAKTQMAVWFFLIVVSYVFLWFVNNALDTISSTVLALMGIGAGTALGAHAQNSNKSEKLKKEKEDLDAKNSRNIPPLTPDEQQRIHELSNILSDTSKLEQEQKLINSIAAPSPQQLQRLDEIKKILKQRSSEDFITDVLTDDVGISFHRYQMFVWTIVLAIIFIAQVYRNLAMPEFNTTLLALMGISSGTYLGFMITEPHPSDK